VIHDGHGRPVFELFRFRRAGEAPATSALASISTVL